MFRKNALKSTLRLVAVLALLVLTASIAMAQAPNISRADRATPQSLPDSISGARLDAPVSGDASALINSTLNPILRDATGRQRVVVRLSQPAAAEASQPADQGLAQQAAMTQQSAVVASARALDGRARVLGTVKLALNAVMLEIDAAALPALAANPNVVSINPVRDYEMTLLETVPYIGAAAVQDMGYDGAGVRVGVIDSGIDYTHAALGGSGDPADWANNDPAIIEPGTFPTAKVVGGYDFVGSTWPNTAEAPDPDPLDDGAGAGHGTHVAHIIGGEGGVAPAVDLYALKVCSSIATSCSGVAMLMAIDFALDPDGDGNMDDRLDVINMSIGSDMGSPAVDDTSFAIENASRLGLLAVISAGNGSDIPYMHGTPGSTPSSLAVAQTQVPSAILPVMVVLEPASIAGNYQAAYQPWSAPLTERIEAPLQYGDGEGGQLLGCSLGADPNSTDPANAPYPPGSLTGKIVLVDRGICSISIKIHNIAYGGGLAGVVGLVAPGAPLVFSYGGGDPSVPGFSITQADANRLKGALATGEVVLAFDPADGIPLVQHMAGSSSRGPSIDFNAIKPDIGAPGASVSAEAGTGTEMTAFSGTSGAAPMVTGSAALLMDAYPGRNWAEIKSVLMNTAETDIMNSAAAFGGYLAPISRIGGGEVRVDRALASPIAAWDRDAMTGSLSFGFHDVTGQLDLMRRVTIRNYTNRAVTLRSEVDYRYDNDANGEVRISAPSWFTVPANGSVSVPVRVFIRPRLNRPLHDWVLNAGSNGNNPHALTEVEYDGYIHFIGVGAAGQNANVHVAWHVLPRGAGNIETGFVRDSMTGWVRNTGMSAAYIDTYSLIGTSPNEPENAPGSNQRFADIRWVGVQTYPVPAGYCSGEDSFVMSFAVTSWERTTHPIHASYWVYLDIDEDGVPEYAVFNADVTLNNVTDGRNLAWVVDLATGLADAWFYTGHNTNSANTVLTFCAEQIGLDASALLSETINVDVEGQDWYFGGPSDWVEGLSVVPLGERYFTIFQNGGIAYTELPPRSTRVGFAVIDFSDQLNATETGLLWLYGPGAPRGNEARIWTFQP